MVVDTFMIKFVASLVVASALTIGALFLCSYIKQKKEGSL